MKKLVEICVMIMLVMLMVGETSARLVHVGGNKGWSQGVNYTIWASQQTFYVGDWIGFKYLKNYYDVLEVNQTSYETCNSANFITNITRGGGNDVFQLNETRPYYFICSKGYCYGGMKLAIDVKNSSFPPAPAPQGNYAAGPSMYAENVDVIPVLVVAISVFIVLFTSVF